MPKDPQPMDDAQLLAMLHHACNQVLEELNMLRARVSDLEDEQSRMLTALASLNSAIAIVQAHLQSHEGAS